MTEPYLFGRFTVRPDQRQLLVDGVPATLGARAFDLLLALIERRERLVTKSELLDLVWPGVAVEENNLQVHVSALRKLLGPQAIATIPGRGYRFTLPPDTIVPPHATVRPDETRRSEDNLRIGPSPPPDERALRIHAPKRDSLLGRDRDLTALLGLLAQHRLVTLTGPGGMGKTTLARHALQERPEGSLWVELAPLNDATLIVGEIAQALSLQLVQGADTLAAVVAALKPIGVLLVIDNAEHLLDGTAALVSTLLQAAPDIGVLVTSQTPLKLADEHVLRLEALSVPDATEREAQRVAEHGSVALFVARARAADHRFVLGDDNLADVVDVCRRLDGLPLAIELAAARTPLLGTKGVAARLDDRFKLLTGSHRGVPSRHQALQATLDWSLALLPTTERRVFEQLGVFAGGFSWALVREALVDDTLDEWALIDALALLADHSLLNVSHDDPPRYSLGETARAHALAVWQPSDENIRRNRHATGLRRLFDAAPGDWLRLSDAHWLARYEPELGNLRAALAWTLKHDAATLIALVGAAAPLWHHLSLHAEAAHWHDLSEPLLNSQIAPAAAAQWWKAAQWVWSARDPERSRVAAAKAEGLYRQLGDAHGLYAQLTGLAGMASTPAAAAQRSLAEALSVEQPDWPPRERAWGQRARADVARTQGRLEDSIAARDTEISLRVAAGDERGELRARLHRADLQLAMNRVDPAVDEATQLVSQLRAQRSPETLAAALDVLIRALRAQGNELAASALQPEADALARR